MCHPFEFTLSDKIIALYYFERKQNYILKILVTNMVWAGCVMIKHYALNYFQI